MKMSEAFGRLYHYGYDPYNSADLFVWRAKWLLSTLYGKFAGGVQPKRMYKMKKRDEIEQPGSCLNKAAEDEPLFVLRAKDPHAPGAVEHWASNAQQTGLHEPAKIAEARAIAEGMRDWHREHIQSNRTHASAAAANKFEGVEERRNPLYGAPVDQAAIDEHFKREQIKGYRQTVAMTAGATLLATRGRESEGPLTDAELKQTAVEAAKFAAYLAAEMYPEETGNA